MQGKVKTRDNKVKNYGLKSKGGGGGKTRPERND